jgi:hypothetical protein
MKDPLLPKTTAGDLVTDGIIWKATHGELLSPEQFIFWMNHPLPFGWSIIRPPLEWT